MLKIRIGLFISGVVEFFGFCLSLVMSGKFPDDSAWSTAWLLFLCLIALTVFLWFTLNEVATKDDIEELWATIGVLDNTVLALSNDLYEDDEESMEEVEESMEEVEDAETPQADATTDLALQDPTEPDVVVVRTGEQPVTVHVQQEAEQPTEQIEKVASQE